MRTNRTKTLVLCSIFAALTAAGAFIKIPVPLVPFTLQFLFTSTAGILLGSKYGALSVMIYIFLGLLGVPVFANGGGLSYILQPSFGYLPGFALGSFVTGSISERVSNPGYRRLLAANVAGLLVVYAVGMLYCAVINALYLGSPVSLWALFVYCFVLAVPGDVVLCFAGAALAGKLLPIVRRSC